MRLHEMGLRVDDPSRRDNREVTWVALPEGTRVTGTAEGFTVRYANDNGELEFRFTEQAPGVEPPSPASEPSPREREEQVLQAVAGAPLSIADIAARLRMSEETVRAAMRELSFRGRVRAVEHPTGGGPDCWVAVPASVLARQMVLDRIARGPVKWDTSAEDLDGRIAHVNDILTELVNDYTVRREMRDGYTWLSLPLPTERPPEGKVPLHQEGRDLYGDTEFWAWLGRTYTQHTPWAGEAFTIEGPFGGIAGEASAVRWPGMFGKAYKLKAAAGYTPEEATTVLAAFRTAANVEEVLGGAKLGASAAPVASARRRLSVEEISRGALGRVHAQRTRRGADGPLPRQADATGGARGLRGKGSLRRPDGARAAERGPRGGCAREGRSARRRRAGRAGDVRRGPGGAAGASNGRGTYARKPCRDAPRGRVAQVDATSNRGRCADPERVHGVGRPRHGEGRAPVPEGLPRAGGAGDSSMEKPNTPMAVCQAVAQALAPRLDGLVGQDGHVHALEPAAGTGNFVRALSGPGFEAVTWHAVEYSAVSAALLRAMRPELDLFGGSFERWVAERGKDFGERSAWW